MHDRIHIVQLIKNFNIESGGGGIERFGISLAQALDPHLFQTSVCGLWDTGTTFEQERIQQLSNHEVNAFTFAKWTPLHPYQAFFRAFVGLRRWLHENPADILHSHSEFSDMIVVAFGLCQKPAIIRTVHNREWIKRPLRRMLLTNFLFPLLFQQEIGVSMGIVNSLNHRVVARLLHKSALCLHNAVNLDRFTNIMSNTAMKRRELGLPVDTMVIGSIGRLTRQKGYPVLLDAAVRVINEIPGVYFVIVGDGEDLETLRNQGKSLGISDKLLFTGPRQDVETILPVFDLFVSSSLWEGLPTVIMESMAAGVPVVATDIPGTRELAVNNAIGWLAQPGNAEDLAEAILTAIQNPAQREKCLQNARNVVQSFSIQSVASAHAKLYDEIAGKG